MSFFADKQTLEDLNIPGRYKKNSIASLFNAAMTDGGRKLIDQLFQRPLTDAAEINKRSNIFQFFTNHPVDFPFTEEESSLMESYLSTGGGGLLSVFASIVSKKTLQVLAQDKDYDLLVADICNTIQLLRRFYQFIDQQPMEGNPFNEELSVAKAIFANPKLSWLITEKRIEQLSLFELARYDYLLRTGMHKEMQQLIEILFRLDVYIAVANVARNKHFTFARAVPRQANVLHAKGLYHPVLDNAVGNTLDLHEENNVLFLTGANMAGKSTLMKSFGIAVYLAHMGFPIAASAFEFSVKDGLYSSINVPDSLDMGYSHFYAEVLRVKTVAEQVAADKDLIVIFDELFKGTNVMDAYDATLSITEAFSENRNCFFMISTHIIEVGEKLRERCSNFNFSYLPTLMDGHIPRYTYMLTEGITTDRHGMLIIENEGILDLLNSSSLF